MSRLYTTLLVTAALTAFGTRMSAAEYTTPGDGAVYTLSTLAEIEGSGVSYGANPSEYIIDGTVTIDAADSFFIADARTVKMTTDSRLHIKGVYQLECPEPVVFTRTDAEAAPAGLVIDTPQDLPEFSNVISNITFEYVQLLCVGEDGFGLEGCTFTEANGVLSSTGALALGGNGAAFTVTDCRFESCTVPAIGCPANYLCPLTVVGCTFIDNNTANTNKPQLNLTTAGEAHVTIDGCTITGTGRDMVGGIALGNLLMSPGENMVTVKNCTITECRYGLTGVGPMTMLIADNTFINNCHEANPMNGGSAISLSGYGYGLDAIITGNHIEKSLWGVTLIYCRDVNLGEVDNPTSPGRNVFVDNGNNGVPYDLYNNGQTTVYAQLNTWSVPEQTEEQIESVIYHKADDPSLGEVIFMPPYDPSGIPAVGIDAPAASETLYDLQGRRAQGTAPGLYIDTKGRKIRR